MHLIKPLRAYVRASCAMCTAPTWPTTVEGVAGVRTAELQKQQQQCCIPLRALRCN